MRAAAHVGSETVGREERDPYPVSPTDALRDAARSGWSKHAAIALASSVRLTPLRGAASAALSDILSPPPPPSTGRFSKQLRPRRLLFFVLLMSLL